VGINGGILLLIIKGNGGRIEGGLELILDMAGIEDIVKLRKEILGYKEHRETANQALKRLLALEVDMEAIKKSRLIPELTKISG
jgi:hypothetical protein